ncbi:MAG: putative bifunctional diguanylate cyclase/phosphodiesterase [Thermoleophilaceae bacterium]
MLVHLWGGTIEAHFHFFVVIPILILYQDWGPFLLALVYVVIHHGALGALDPSSVYNHPSAIAHPWRWALVHGGFVVGASVASIVGWRVNEQMLREPLTGLAGRAAFLHRVNLALDRLRRGRLGLAVLYLDLDRFKVLNDTLGHAVGDQLLVEVARRLRSCTRRGDTVARLGGDEFGILCEQIHGEHEVFALAERITAALRRPVGLNGLEVQTSASVGISFTDSAAVAAEELIGDADMAMYRAKSRRGDRFVVFDEGMRAEHAQRYVTETELRRALERDELRLLYQPIVSADNGRPVACEALLRWQHPERGLVPPAEFMLVAEQSGLIVPIGAWVLREACREAKRWSVSGESPASYVCVNLSARQFAQPDLVDTVREALDEAALQPSRLGLEVTESVLMEEADSPIETLTALKRLGVHILLDDFGTGYSSLSYLRNFPIDVIKVDRSFVKGVGGDREDEAILAAVVGLSRALGLTVVAEGVETESQLSRIRVLGCELVQGYYISLPRPPTELDDLLRRETSAWRDRSADSPVPVEIDPCLGGRPVSARART